MTRTPWLMFAAEAAQHLDGLGGPEKREAMRKGAERGWPSPQNVQRMLVARAYVLANAKNSGLALSDVKASYEAAEALLRIAKLSPTTASSLMRDVLTGEKSGREVRKILADMRDAPQGRSAIDDNWRVYWTETVEVLFGDNAASISVANNGHSARGAWLGLDLEIVLQNGANAAVFLSPICKYSTWAGKTVEAQMPSVLSAMAYYKHVYFIIYDEREELLIAKLLKEGNWGKKTIITHEPIPWDETVIA